MWQSIEKPSSEKFSSFRFMHESIIMAGYYGPYWRVYDRTSVFVTVLTSSDPERQITTFNPNHTKSGHLKPAIDALEALSYCADYWAIVGVNVQNDFLSNVLFRYKYTYDPKKNEFYKLLRGQVKTPQNDPKTLMREVESDF